MPHELHSWRDVSPRSLALAALAFATSPRGLAPRGLAPRGLACRGLASRPRLATPRPSGEGSLVARCSLASRCGLARFFEKVSFFLVFLSPLLGKAAFRGGFAVVDA